MAVPAHLSRLLSRQLRHQYTPATRQAFHHGRPTLAASNLTMPALSPTMTEGNIASWQVKEGDSYSIGDVLCEIETDKATMALEAQDDGVMAKIVQGDQSKGIQVGTLIAVTAEQGDDLSLLEMPPPPEKPSSSETRSKSPKVLDETAAPPTKDNTSHASTSPSTSDQPPSPMHPSNTEPETSDRPLKSLLPSVLSLLAQNDLTPADVPQIPSSGPSGRLTKGDVLSYLNKIPKSYSQDLSSSIRAREKLDFSNIKIRPGASTKDPAAATDSYPGPRAAPAKDAKTDKPEPPKEIEVILPISLRAVLEVQERVSESLGVHLPLSTFVARATELANEDLPLSRGQTPTVDQLFDAVLGLDKVDTSASNYSVSRGNFLPQISALTHAPSAAPKGSRPAQAAEPDIFDILSGNPGPAKPAASPRVQSTSNALPGGPNVFRLIVKPGEENRARTFLERMKTTLEAQPGRLIL